MIDASTGVISTIAGNGSNQYGSDNGPALSTGIGQIFGLAVDGNGNVFFADAENNVIRMLVPNGTPCSYIATPAIPATVSAAGGNLQLAVQTGASCPWSFTGAFAALPNWITMPAGASGSGPANATLNVATNGGAARSAILNLNGSQVLVSQAAAAGVCIYALNPAERTLPATGGSASFAVTAPTGCSWSLATPPVWISITSTASGSGNLTVSYQAAANAGGARTGIFNLNPGVAGVAPVPFQVDQNGDVGSTLTSAGSLAHFASGGGWRTTFTLVNTTSTDASAQLNFFNDLDDTATPILSTPVVLPLDIPEFGQTALQASTLQRTLGPGTALALESTGPVDQKGGAQLLTSGGIDGFAVFRYESTRQEAVVPLETRLTQTFLLPFDNTNGYINAVAVSNVSAQSVTLNVSIIDGATGGFKGSHALTLPGFGHQSFLLPTAYPETANSIGTVMFIGPPSGQQISVLGIRVNTKPANTPFTSVPSLVTNSEPNGTFPHFDAGAGWKTSYTLVNTGSSMVNVQLNFFGDNGAPVAPPLSLPQSPATTLTPSISLLRSLAPGTVLLIDSGGTDPTEFKGSTQLISDGNIGAYAVFKNVNSQQEAVVPLETRSAASYLLAFDNTRGYANGVAVSNLTNQAVNVQVRLRYAQTGAPIGPFLLQLQPRQHTSFLLANQFPLTAQHAGTLEFATPFGGQIAVLGIRVNPDGAFTSIPPLQSTTAN